MTTTTRRPRTAARRLPLAAARRLAKSVGAAGYPDAHAIAVARCAAGMARQLALAPAERRAVVEGALLHDVGKVRIDPRILEKPGPLTKAERRRVNAHPLEGERLVGSAVDPSVTDVVRAHHERWDGAGYPSGLAADEIPLAARVVAVADAFLAMLEDRPYRAPLSRAAALRELRAGAGTQFDPRCVAALTRTVAARAGA